MKTATATAKRWRKDGRQTWIDQQDGYVITHCGHPTALWPYAITSPDDGRLIIAPNGRAFQYLADAQAAAELLAAGTLVLGDQHGSMARAELPGAGPAPGQTTWIPSRSWKAIRQHREGATHGQK